MQSWTFAYTDAEFTAGLRRDNVKKSYGRPLLASSRESERGMIINPSKCNSLESSATLQYFSVTQNGKSVLGFVVIGRWSLVMNLHIIQALASQAT